MKIEFNIFKNKPVKETTKNYKLGNLRITYRRRKMIPELEEVLECDTIE